MLGCGKTGSFSLFPLPFPCASNLDAALRCLVYGRLAEIRRRRAVWQKWLPKMWPCAE